MAKGRRAMKLRFSPNSPTTNDLFSEHDLRQQARRGPNYPDRVALDADVAVQPSVPDVALFCRSIFRNFVMTSVIEHRGSMTRVELLVARQAARQGEGTYPSSGSL